MQLRAEEISRIIKGQIQSFDQKTEVQETGSVLTVGDGVFETILVRDAPIIPVYDYVRRYLVAPGVQGWVTSGRGPTPSRFLSVQPPAP